MRLSRGVPSAVLVVALLGWGLGGAASAQGTQPKASDVGITNNQIRLAVVADVDTPVQPGLFQSAVDSMNAFARTVNAHGGIAGRKVVIDFIDSHLSPNDTRNAIIKACSQDFAMVGTEALFMNNVDDMVACKDAQGNATGLPDLTGIAIDTHEKCSPVSFLVNGDSSFCATLGQHPQTYTAQQGDCLYYLSQNKDLHGIYILPGDLQEATNSQRVPFEACVNLGIKKDATGFYSVSAMAPQSALTPYVAAVKSSNSTFVYQGDAFPVMVELRREAKAQGVSTVKVWACNQGCYDSQFLAQGGSDVEGTSTILTTLPFYSEYKSNASLKTLVQQLGGVSKLNGNGVEAWLAALLFQDAAQKAMASGATLNRASLLAALRAEHAFTAQGILGPTDVGGHQQPRCIVIATVKNGQWVRTNPSKVGTFDCNPKNLTQIKLDLTG